MPEFMPLPKRPKTLAWGFRVWKHKDGSPVVVWAKQHKCGAWLFIREDEGLYSTYWSNKASLTKGEWSCVNHRMTKEEAFDTAAAEWYEGKPPAYCVPFRRDKKRDNQQAKLYRWERVSGMLRGREIVSHDQVRELVAKVFSETKVCGFSAPAPNVKFTLRGGAHSTWGGSVLNFSPSCRTVPIVLHECAHSLLSLRRSGNKPLGTVQSHGPEFVSVFCQLLDKYDDDRLLMYKHSARSFGLKVDDKDYLTWE